MSFLIIKKNEIINIKRNIKYYGNKFLILIFFVVVFNLGTFESFLMVEMDLVF